MGHVISAALNWIIEHPIYWCLSSNWISFIANKSVKSSLMQHRDGSCNTQLISSVIIGAFHDWSIMNRFECASPRPFFIYRRATTSIKISPTAAVAHYRHSVIPLFFPFPPQSFPASNWPRRISLSRAHTHRIQFFHHSIIESLSHTKTDVSEHKSSQPHRQFVRFQDKLIFFRFAPFFFILERRAKAKEHGKFFLFPSNSIKSCFMLKARLYYVQECFLRFSDRFCASFPAFAFRCAIFLPRGRFKSNLTRISEVSSWK